MATAAKKPWAYSVSGGSVIEYADLAMAIPDLKAPLPAKLNRVVFKCKDGSTIEVTRHGQSLILKPSAIEGVTLQVH